MVKETKAHTLIKQVYYHLNLLNAWEKVRSNGGCGGIDGVKIEEFAQHLEANLKIIEEQLKTDTYRPQPSKRVWIPKSDGGRRPLGIPTIRDRLVQQAIRIRLEPIFDHRFEESSYGYRRGRSAHQALGDVAMCIAKGNRWIVEVDIKGYFDTINQNKLMDFIAERISDGRVLRLIKEFLHAGVMEDFHYRKTITGTPQGGTLSPLLANIYLDYYDKRMKATGLRVIRYADDWVIPCRSRQQAQRALELTRRIIEQDLKLHLHPEKTRITHIKQGFEFLGYLFKEGYSLYAFPTIKAIKAFKQKIRRVTNRRRPLKMSEIIRQLNEVIRGWGCYFRLGSVKRLFWRLDCWIRWRIRAFRTKCWVWWCTAIGKSYTSKFIHQSLGLVSLYSLKTRKQSTSV
jgi:group II intron reverse transcriptase/maturase